MVSFEDIPELLGLEASASLVEEDRIRIDGLIETDFMPPNSVEMRNIGQTEVLLAAPRNTVVFAAKDLGYIRERTRFVANRLADPRYSFTKDQLHEVNHHPYIRTLALTEIVQIINIEGTLIREAAKNMEIEPAMPAGIMDSHYSMNMDRYNKDQIVALHGYLKERLTPPPDAIAEEKIIAVTNITGGALKDIKRVIGASADWYKDPENGRGKPYLMPGDVFKVLKYVKDPEYRRSFQGD